MINSLFSPHKFLARFEIKYNVKYRKVSYSVHHKHVKNNCLLIYLYLFINLLIN